MRGVLGLERGRDALQLGQQLGFLFGCHGLSISVLGDGRNADPLHFRQRLGMSRLTLKVRRVGRRRHLAAKLAGDQYPR